MRKLVASILVVAFTVISPVAQAKTTKYTVPKGERTLYVIGPVDGSMLQLANKIERLSAESNKDIHIMINSPGGAVVVGLQIIQAIDIARARGVKVVCAVGVLAASMAFQLLPHCSERYAMKRSLLLFHPARAMVRGGITGEQALMIGKELARIDGRAAAENEAMMGSLERGWMARHFRNETLWEAKDLVSETKNNWLTIVDILDTPNGAFNLTGEDDAREQLKRARKGSFMFDSTANPWIIVNI